MKYIIVAVLLLAFGVFVYTRSQPKENKPLNTPSQTALSVQTNSEGTVTVDATPVEVSGAAKSWKFKIALNTHSDELTQDLTQTVTMADDKGNLYNPISWEGSPPGGHHREGTLLFQPITPRPKNISLIIKNIGGVPERKFNWTLGGE
jgi:hypothetical protein